MGQSKWPLTEVFQPGIFGWERNRNWVECDFLKFGDSQVKKKVC